MKKKNSFFRRIALAASFLIGSCAVVGASLNQGPGAAIETSAASTTYSLTQNQVKQYTNQYGDAGDSPDWRWSFFYWSDSDGYITCGGSASYGPGCSQQNIEFMNAYSASISIYVFDCASDATITLRYKSKEYTPVALKKGQLNNYTWTGLPGGDGYIQWKMSFNATTPTKFGGTTPTAPMFSVNCSTDKPVTITAGTGIKETFLSMNMNATSGGASGTLYPQNSTVYAFVRTKANYTAPSSSWVRMSGTEYADGTLYRVGSKNIGTSSYDFGTMNASPKTMELVRVVDGFPWDPTVKLSYDTAATILVNTLPGYTFKSWNTAADGSGTTYTSSLTATQVNYLIENDIDLFYAIYEANKYNLSLSDNGGTGGQTGPFVVTYDGDLPTLTTLPTRDGYVFGGYEYGSPSPELYYDAEGKPLSTWDIAGNATFKAVWTGIPYSVKATAGEGVSKVTLSAYANGTDRYDPADKKFPFAGDVYCFAELERGYKPSDEGWVKVSGDADVGGAVYRVGQKTVQLGDDTTDFGTINATLGNYVGNIEAGKGVSAVYTSDDPSGNTLYVPSHTYPYGSTFYGFVELGEGYNALPEWGEPISGEPNEADTLYLIGAHENLDVNDEGFGTVDASPKTYPLYLDGLPGEFEATYDAPLPDLEKFPERDGYSFDGYYDQDGNEYIDDEGHGTKPWDKNSDGQTLYPHWTKDIGFTVIGYEAEYDREQHTGSISGIDPEDSVIRYGLTEGVYDLTEIPTFQDVGEHVVYYEITHVTVGDEVYTVHHGKITVTVNSCDFSSLEDVLEEAEDLYDKIEPTFVDIGNYIHEGIIEAVEFHNDPNRLPEEIAAATDKLQGFIDNALKHYTERLADKVIPVVYGDPDYQANLDEVLETYKGLDDEQKAMIDPDMVKNLEDAEAAVGAMNDIDDLPDPNLTPEFKDDLEAARERYEGLTDDQKAQVDPDVLQDLSDKEEALAVMELIDDALTDAKVGQDTKDALKAARDAYDDLSDDQKALVANYDDLLKAEADYPLAENVDGMINSINEIDIDSGDDIQAARDAYEALTEDQKDYIPPETLKHLNDLEDAYAVLAPIHEIGNVQLTEDSQKKIEDARAAYDALTSEQKALIAEKEVKILVDAEKVYAGLELINNIGEVEYSTESYDKIEAAREYYDSLSEDQKAMIGDKPFKTLTAAEQSYADQHNGATALVIIMLIVVCCAILAGGFMIYYLLYKKDWSKGKGAKTMSIAGVPFVFLISHYVDPAFVALYVLSVIAILVWLTVLVIYLYKKGFLGFLKPVADKLGPACQKAVDWVKVKVFHKKLEEKSEEKPEEAPTTQTDSVEQAEEEEEVKTFTDEKGNVFRIRYERSFTAKMCQGTDLAKSYYRTIKNHALSYKRTNSRVSWGYDSINLGREKVLKFAVKGKTLCVYFAIDPESLEPKYKVEKVESKKYAEVPCLYRIKNDRRLGYALQIIDMIMERLNGVKGEPRDDDYPFPYQTTEALVAQGLIKEHILPVEEQPEEEAPATAADSVEEEEEEVTVTDEKGNVFRIRYERSFTAKMCQAPDEVKAYYRGIKNHVLSYKKANSRISWGYDAVNLGHEKIMKFTVRGKTLCVYLALDPEALEPKYKVEKIESKKYAETPCLYRIKNERRYNYAMQLIDMIMERIGAVKGEPKDDDYPYPYQTTEALVAQGLIKERRVSVSSLSFLNRFSGYERSFTAKMCQASDEAKGYYRVIKNHALSYKRANTRISWSYDSINLGRQQVLKLSVKGKTLVVYLAIDPETLEPKYKVEKVESKKYAEVPCLYRIKNERRLNYTLDLIDQIMARYEAVKGAERDDEYPFPHQSNEALLAAGLMKKRK